MQIVDNLSRLMAGNEAWLWAIVPFAAMAYLAPLLIAFERRHRYAWTIGALNLATGWTLVGWLAALVWAVNRDVREPALEAVPAPGSGREPRWNDTVAPADMALDAHLKKCPYCAEGIRAEAIVCRYCGRDLVLPQAQPQRPAADLDAQEKQRLERLLAAETGEDIDDPRLLDVFEYARLLEAREPLSGPNVIALAAGGAAGQQREGPDPAVDPDAWPDSDRDFAEPATGNRR